MTTHTVKTIASGEYSCSCGAIWDRDEGDECPGSETPLQLGTRLHAEAQESLENSAAMRELLGTQTLADEICAALTQRDQPALAYRQKLAARLRAAMPTGCTLCGSNEHMTAVCPMRGNGAETFKVVGYLSHCTDGYDPDAPPPLPQEPLMTVAQHLRIMATTLLAKP